jgi:general stress protein YciG
MANESNQGGNPGGGGKASRGFAAMEPAKQREIASKGGSASGGNFANDPERAREAGRKGGEVSGGNFANSPERASAAGRKGGEASRERRSGGGNPGGAGEGNR